MPSPNFDHSGTNTIGRSKLQPTEDDAAITDFDEILVSDLADPAYRALHESAARDLDEEIARHRARRPLDESNG